MKKKTDKPEKNDKAKDLFAETKIKMMMDIYHVSRSKAVEMIAAREAELAEAASKEKERQPDQNADWKPRRHRISDRIVSAEEFFGR